MSETLDTLGRWAEAEGRKRGVLDQFVYLNYANGLQRVYERSTTTEDLERMRKAQEMYDSSGVFKKLWKGGFKIPQRGSNGSSRDEL
jgi:hypothetical protein